MGIIPRCGTQHKRGCPAGRHAVPVFPARRAAKGLLQKPPPPTVAPDPSGSRAPLPFSVKNCRHVNTPCLKPSENLTPSYCAQPKRLAPLTGIMLRCPAAPRQNRSGSPSSCPAKTRPRQRMGGWGWQWFHFQREPSSRMVSSHCSPRRMLSSTAAGAGPPRRLRRSTQAFSEMAS